MRHDRYATSLLIADPCIVLLGAFADAENLAISFAVHPDRHQQRDVAHLAGPAALCAELTDVLDDLGRPDVVTLDQVASRANLLQPCATARTDATSRIASRPAAMSPFPTRTTPKDAGRSAAPGTRSTARPPSRYTTASPPPSSSPARGRRGAIRNATHDS